MSLTPEQIQKNIDTYNRLNPPSPERDAQEAFITALHDLLTMTPDEYFSTPRTKEEVRTMRKVMDYFDNKIKANNKGII